MTYGAESDNLSQHPTDILMRTLIATGRPPTTGELEEIVERLSASPFDRDLITVPVRDRGIRYQTWTVTARCDSLGYHLVKRVMIDKQWALGTTAPQYLDDLRHVILSPNARLALFLRRGGHMAAAIAPTDQVIPSSRLGALPEKNVLTVYSADRGIIVSGYLVSSIEAAAIPGEARWLK